MPTRSQPYGIEGITDDPRPTILAKAKIGQISADGLPEKLDHIVFVHPENGQEVRAFRRLGERPTSFLAVLPADDHKSFLDCAWKCVIRSKSITENAPCRSGRTPHADQ